MSDQVDFVYPPLIDPLDTAVRMLPPAVRGSPFMEFEAALLEPFAQIDAQLADFVSGMGDPSTAAGDALAALGANVGEYQGSLQDWEFRRIVLGRRAAEAARRDPVDSRIWAMWLLLTGARAEDATVTTYARGEIRMEAIIEWTPSQAWITRSGRVVRRAIRDGINPIAVVGRRDVARWGAGRYGVNTYAWRLAP